MAPPQTKPELNGFASVQTQNRVALMGILSSLSYSFCSVSMVMSNKALAYNYTPRLTFLLVSIQSFVGTLIVEVGRRRGYAKYDPFNVSTAKRWLPVSLCFSTMLFTSLKALEIMNVPMVTVFKNLTNIVIVTGDWYFFQQSASTLVVASMFVMVFGALVASYNDLHFDPWGYFWMLANCCATAGYVLYMKYATKSIKLPRFGMVFYNNLLTTCLLLPAAYAAGEFRTLMEAPQLHTPWYAFVNCFSGVVGVMLNFASLWCVGTTSATTYAVVGSINVIPTALLGYWLFGAAINQQMAEFMIVSMTGGFIYSFAKLQEKKRFEALKQTASGSASPKRGVAVESAAFGADSRSPLLEGGIENGDQTNDHKA